MSVKTLNANFDSNLIFDVGMHKGEDTAYYLKKGYKVVAFEANPDLVNENLFRFNKEINDGCLKIVAGAIVDDPALYGKKVSFFINNDNSVWGTLKPEWAKRNEMLGTTNKEIKVEAIDFSKCIQDYGMPYYLKIDVEGVDKVCLTALKDFNNRPSYVSIESEKLIFQSLIEEINIFQELGYSKFKAIQQQGISNSQDLIVKDNKTIEYHFSEGSSGLFGDSTKGAWMNEKEIINKYLKIFRYYKWFGDFSIFSTTEYGKRFKAFLEKKLATPLPGWYDTHAKHSTVI